MTVTKNSELVTIQNGKSVTSSLQIAETFSKEHRNVIRDIENLKIDVLKFEQMFSPSYYLDSYNRKQPMYIITRDGFTLLAMGFTGKKALQFKIAYIDAFNQMEDIIFNRSRSEYDQKEIATLKAIVKLITINRDFWMDKYKWILDKYNDELEKNISVKESIKRLL